jgi:aminoglycoside phosphotransferase family enzyme/predicted kinase
MTNPTTSADGRVQDAVFRWLDDPATHADAKVRRCDTHAAVVFLAGDRALKVKRAVKFPFLDYSTLAKRRAACQSELDVNRAFAPQLYRRVVAITREPDGRLALDGQGEPVEWAVEMRRFDEDQTLDHLADRGAVTEELAGKLAIMTVAMHEHAEPVAPAPWLAAVEDYLQQNTDAFRQNERLFRADLVADLDRRSRAALARLRPLLAARGEAGLIRRGHGDLHLGNIALIDGEPIAFDAIEFDPVIASGDLLYDLAFLLMDLVERDLRHAANIVLNGYFAAARRDADCDGIAALPFFMSLRAAIRAKVTAARLDQMEEGKAGAIARSAERYFQLALDLLAPSKPVVVCTGGLSGTGKSMLARSLAPDLQPVPGALVLRSDVERKAMFGVAETKPLPPDAYTAKVSAEVYGLLNDKAARIARAGHSVIVDAVFAKAAEREAVKHAMHGTGAEFRGLFLTADLQTRIARVGGREADASDANAAVARQQEAFDLGAMEWAMVDASGTPDQTLARARQAIK